MRLWHESIITQLPRQQLLGQHRECCALRGNGWGRKQSTIDYVFKYSPYFLYRYHLLVMNEMKKRGYSVTEGWLNKNYCGQYCQSYTNMSESNIPTPIYNEHNEKYLKDCIENLKSKGIEIIYSV